MLKQIIVLLSIVDKVDMTAFDEALNANGWMQALADDIKAIHVERIYRARQEVIICYHEIGERIVTDANWQKWQRGNENKLSYMTELSGISERDLRRAIQLYEKYPRIEKLYDEADEGKNLSWYKVVNKYLPDGKQKQPPEPCICPACGREHTKMEG